MPRKVQYVVCVYRAGTPVAIVGMGGFWRMCWTAVALVCRSRWQLGALDHYLEHSPLDNMRTRLMDTIESPKVMH